MPKISRIGVASKIWSWIRLLDADSDVKFWMISLVDSVLPAPDSPLEDEIKKKDKSKILMQNLKREDHEPDNNALIL